MEFGQLFNVLDFEVRQCRLVTVSGQPLTITGVSTTLKISSDRAECPE